MAVCATQICVRTYLSFLGSKCAGSRFNQFTRSRRHHVSQSVQAVVVNTSHWCSAVEVESRGMRHSLAISRAHLLCYWSSWPVASSYRRGSCWCIRYVSTVVIMRRPADQQCVCLLSGPVEHLQGCWLADYAIYKSHFLLADIDNKSSVQADTAVVGWESVVD